MKRRERRGKEASGGRLIYSIACLEIGRRRAPRSTSPAARPASVNGSTAQRAVKAGEQAPRSAGIRVREGNRT